MLPCYATAIGLLPAALGRCDSLYVFQWRGTARVSLAAFRSRVQGVPAVWLGALMVFMLWGQGITNHMFRFRGRRHPECDRYAISLHGHRTVLQTADLYKAEALFLTSSLEEMYPVKLLT